MSAAEPLDAAIGLLRATRLGDGGAVDRYRQAVADLDEVMLVTALGDDRARLAFWIDLYNAAVQLQPRFDFEGWRGRNRFFRQRVIIVAGHALSLDDIEHGILRRSRPKAGLGYITHPWPAPFELRHRVLRVDPRIHFALNCAATSCPPIDAYDSADLEAQLDLATRAYLEGAVESGLDGIAIPAVFLWFIGDFGGPPGVRRFLKRHGVVGWGRRIRFASWDWTPAPGKWASTESQATTESWQLRDR